MPEIANRLRDSLPSLPRKLAIAARFALDNPDRIALESMRAVASACNVASPTMLRLARAMGYDSYEAFRDEFKRRLVESGFGTRAMAIQNVIALDGEGFLGDMIAEAATSNLARARHSLSRSAVQDFVDGVHRAQTTYIVGHSSMYWLAGLMENTGRLVFKDIRADHSHSMTPVEDTASISSRDAVIALSALPYARRTVETVRLARERAARVYVITDRPSSPLVPYADVVFYAPTDSPHYYPSLIGFAYIIEVLLASAVAHGDALERLKIIDALRNESGELLS
jgi:DNA-binding MurR/RpiR family transcriptional regulator